MRGSCLLIVFVALTGCQQAGEEALRDIENQVAEDAVAQYEMVDRHGSAIDRCVQAGLVSAAYLQAKNEEQYQFWKTIENLNCANAGMP